MRARAHRGRVGVSRSGWEREHGRECPSGNAKPSKPPEGGGANGGCDKFGKENWIELKKCLSSWLPNAAAAPLDKKIQTPTGNNKLARETFSIGVIDPMLRNVQRLRIITYRACHTIQRALDCKQVRSTTLSKFRTLEWPYPTCLN